MKYHIVLRSFRLLRLPRAILGLWLTAIGFVVRAEPAAGSAPLRAALLAWEPVPLRTDVQRVASDLVTLAQAALSAEPGVAWVERAELDKLVAEADFAASGRLDPRTSLRIGKLARAQLLVTGRLDAADHGKTSLTLEAVDLDHGDLLATATAPLPPRPHQHFALRDEDTAAAVAALRGLLAEAAARHRELAARPALALLFFANTGPSSRLDATAGRLGENLREAAARTGGRVLRFPRARDAADEQDLAVFGLAEADDQAWRGVADLYAWGEYKELAADGVEVGQIPVEASLTLWDGATAPRTENWRGTVATFPEAAKGFAAALSSALRPATGTSPEARATGARLLAEQVKALEKLHTYSLEKKDFWASELGKNYQRQRINLLQAAAFLQPGDEAVRLALLNARSDYRARFSNPQAEEVWLQYADRRAFVEAFPDSYWGIPYPDDSMAPPGRSYLVATLQEIIRVLTADEDKRRLYGAEIQRAVRLWIAATKSVPSPKKAPKEMSPSALAAGGEEDPFLEFTHPIWGRNALMRETLDSLWPTFASRFRTRFERNPVLGVETAQRYVGFYARFGEEDAAYRRLLSALAPAAPAAAAPAADTARAAASQAEAITDPPALNPEWGEASRSAPTELGPRLPLEGRTLYRWNDTPPRLPTQAKYGGRALLPADQVRLLGFDGRRLWIDGIYAPENLKDLTKSPRRNIALFAPDTREFTPIGGLLPGESRGTRVVFGSGETFLATAFDGLLRMESRPGAIVRLTPDDGLPSLKLGALARYDGGLVVAAATPERGLARFDAASGRWIDLGVTLIDPTSAPSGGMYAPPQMLLSGLGPWILAGQSDIHLFDTRDGAWSAGFAAHRAEGKKQPPLHADWANSVPRCMLSDGSAFWIGGEYGLVRYDPALPPGQARIESCPPVLALADAGRWLWVAFFPEPRAAPDTSPDILHNMRQMILANPYELPHGRTDPPEWRRSRIALYDKNERRWRGSLEVSGGITSLAAAPGYLWAAGSTLLEFDTRTVTDVDNSWSPVAPSAPAAACFGLPPLPLHLAVSRGDHAGLDRLLAAKEPVDACGAEKWTALHLAAWLGDQEAVTRLLAAGANLQAFTRDGRDALGLAAARGDLVLVRRLLAAGADPKHQARYRAPQFPDLDPPSSRKPVAAPVQPVSGTAEALADGRVRVRWEMAPNSGQDGFVIYRRNASDPVPAIQTGRWVGAGRWESLKEDRYLGNVRGWVRSFVREWIDNDPPAPGTVASYTVIAANAFDGRGPHDPRETGRVTITPRAAPSAGTFETHHLSLDRTALLLAAEAGHADVVAALLTAGADPAAADAGGRTALHLAAYGGHLDTVKLLIGAGTPLDAVALANSLAPERLFLEPSGPGDGGHTALSLVYERHRDEAVFTGLLEAGASPLFGPNGALAPLAAMQGREADMERLLAAGPYPFVIGIGQNTVFTAALSAGRKQLAGRLRERAFDTASPAWSGSLGTAALVAAVRRSDLEMVEWLCTHGAKPDSREGFPDRPPLQLAVERRLPASFVRVLVGAGADPGKLPEGVISAVADPEVRQILAAASSRGVPASDGTVRLAFPKEMISEVFVTGYNPDYYRKSDELKPDLAKLRDRLHAAAAAGDTAAIAACLAAGATVDLQDTRGWTALIHALKAGKREAARTLIDAGADLNHLTNYGSSVLGFATDTGDRAFIAELIDLGADPNRFGENSPSPLSDRLAAGDLSLARELLARGADPRLVVAMKGLQMKVPPLMHAARAGNLAAVKLLVEYGADPKTVLWRDVGHFNVRPCLTALPFAAASNDLATLEYFLGQGLDPKQEATYGNNALDWALFINADRTAARLRALGVKTRAERGLPPLEP